MITYCVNIVEVFNTNLARESELSPSCLRPLSRHNRDWRRSIWPVLSKSAVSLRRAQWIILSPSAACGEAFGLADGLPPNPRTHASHLFCTSGTAQPNSQAPCALSAKVASSALARSLLLSPQRKAARYLPSAAPHTLKELHHAHV
jgi:hypothetical protein